jgi:GntR family transcriptional regulator
MKIYDNNAPIYVQIKNDIEYRIIKGADIKVGGKLPSVRELALEYGVTVVIMQRALTQLQESELIIVKRGIGNFVTADESAVMDIKLNIIKEKQEELVKFLNDINISMEEFMKGVSND